MIKSFCTLDYLSSVFLSCVVCLSFVMITYLVEADVVTSLKRPLKDEEPSIMFVEGLGRLYSK